VNFFKKNLKIQSNNNCNRKKRKEKGSNHLEKNKEGWNCKKNPSNLKIIQNKINID
jgi:hypothetical protein